MSAPHVAVVFVAAVIVLAFVLAWHEERRMR